MGCPSRDTGFLAERNRHSPYLVGARCHSTFLCAFRATTRAVNVVHGVKKYVLISFMLYCTGETPHEVLSTCRFSL